MLEHASIFYLQPAGPYLLCYDSDLEKQPGPKRNWYTKKAGVPGRHKLPRFSVFEPVTRKKRMAMRVIYNPVKTEFSRRLDGFVDRVIVVDNNWLARCATQFQVAFPAGVPNTLLESFNPPELQ